MLVERMSPIFEIDDLQKRIAMVNDQILEPFMDGSLSKEFLDWHSEIKGKIVALKTQNGAYPTLTGLPDGKGR